MTETTPTLRYYPLVLGALTLVLFTTSAQFLIVSPILPRIAEELHVPEARLGGLVTAYAIAVGGFAFIASAGLGVCMLGIAVMPDFPTTFVAFVGTMSLVGIRTAPLNTWVTSLVDSDHRGSLMALWLATSQVGFAMGSGVAGYIFSRFDFIGNAVTGCVGAVLCAVILLVFVAEPAGDGD